MQARQDGLSRRLEKLIEKLPEEKRSSLRELLMSLLEPVQKMQLHRDSLERLEEKYLIALEEEEDSNVIGFRHIEKNHDDALPRKERRWSLKVPSLIEATNYGEIFRMAFELHLRGCRSIFLSWQEIDPAGRHSPQTLRELTSCTIFVPDITNVQSSEQKAILEVLRDPSNEKPHFLAGTFVPYSELQKMRTLNAEFLDAISQAYLKLTKPVAQYKREGLMRYFLESLS